MTENYFIMENLPWGIMQDDEKYLVKAKRDDDERIMIWLNGKKIKDSEGVYSIDKNGNSVGRVLTTKGFKEIIGESPNFAEAYKIIEEKLTEMEEDDDARRYLGWGHYGHHGIE